MANPNAMPSRDVEEKFPPPEGYRWIGDPSGKGARLERVLKADERRPELPAFRIKNTDDHPRTIFPGPGGILAPGEVREVPPEHRLEVHRQLANPIHQGGKTPWLAEFKPAFVVTDEPIVTAEEIAKQGEEAEKARQKALGQA